MTVLFSLAFYVTITSISNLTLKDIINWAEDAVQVPQVSAAENYRYTVLEDKQLNVRKPKNRLLSTNELNGPDLLEEVIEQKQYPKDTVNATGYTSGPESTGKSPGHPAYGITYSGVPVQRDLFSTIAADIDVYPIGTILYIPGYGYGVVADIGGAINGQDIDLYYPTVEEVYANWGKQQLEVYIIEYGSGELSEEKLNQLNEMNAAEVFQEQIKAK